MKKVLIVIGGLTLAVVIAVAGSLAFIAPEGRRLDNSSSEYAILFIDTALKDWDIAAIKAESSEELAAAVKDEQLAQLLKNFSEHLGSVKSHGAPRGEARLDFRNLRKVVTANYIVPVTFEKAEGQVVLRFIRKDDKWRLLALNVNSDGLFK